MVHAVIFPSWHSQDYPFKEYDMRYRVVVFSMVRNKDLGIKNCSSVSVPFKILGTCLEGN